MENIVMDNVITWTIEPYTNLIGDYFWAFMLFITVIAVYLRTRSFGPAFLTMMIGSSILNVVLPGGPFRTIIFFSVVFGIMYTFYRIFVRKASPWSE